MDDRAALGDQRGLEDLVLIVRRELALGPAAVAGEAARLKALLGQDGPLADQEQALCERIAAGDVDPNDPALIAHLWATTLDTLAVDQPNYATYRQAVVETVRAAEPKT